MRKTSNAVRNALGSTGDEATLPINRLSIISDFIFASAMTLMVLFLDFPDPEHIHSGKDLLHYYTNKGSGAGIVNFLSTFFIVGVYWLKHLERFKHYKATNQTHLYFEILFLAFLVLVPIANALSVLFPSMLLIHLFYSTVMFAMGMLAHFSWRYAAQHNLLHAGVDTETRIGIQHESLVEPLVAVEAAILAFIDPLLWDISLLLIPLFFIVQRAYTRRSLRIKHVKMQHHG